MPSVEEFDVVATQSASMSYDSSSDDEVEDHNNNIFRNLSPQTEPTEASSGDEEEPKDTVATTQATTRRQPPPPLVLSKGDRALVESQLVDEAINGLCRQNQELLQGTHRSVRSLEDESCDLTTFRQMKSDHDIAQLICMVRECRQVNPSADYQLVLRINDFRRARFLRYESYGADPYGIFGLFRHLDDLRVDLEWAEDAAYRRTTDKPYFSWIDFDQVHRSQFARHAVFTYIVMILSTVFLIISIAWNGWKLEPASVNPMFGPSPDVLVKLGALDSARIIEYDEWYRLVAAMVLHAGIVHWAINMLALWFIVAPVERVHGTWGIFLAFTASGIGGNMASALFLPHSISVGCSGGIFATLGICVADILVNWKLLTMRDDRPQYNFPYRRVFFWLGFDFVVNIIIGLTPYIDNFAHMGGLFYGLTLGCLYLRRLDGSGFFGFPSWRHRRTLIMWRAVGFVVAVAVFTMSLCLLIQADSSPVTYCKRCRYFSCAPFPFWVEDKWWHCDSCDYVAANLIHSFDTMYVEIDCPYGEVATVDLNATVVVDRDALRAELPSLCRAHCDLL